MKILSLKLENFQGNKALEINFDSKSTSIYGDNATGKTTIFNAVTSALSREELFSMAFVEAH